MIRGTVSVAVFGLPVARTKFHRRRPRSWGRVRDGPPPLGARHAHRVHSQRSGFRGAPVGRPGAGIEGCHSHAHPDGAPRFGDYELRGVGRVRRPAGDRPGEYGQLRARSRPPATSGARPSRKRRMGWCTRRARFVQTRDRHQAATSTSAILAGARMCSAHERCDGESG